MPNTPANSHKTVGPSSRCIAEVMEGERNDEGFKPHHRIAAARELLKRGFDETYTQPAPEARPAETPELITDDSEWEYDEERERYLESPENLARVMEKIERIAEQATPEEREAHEAEFRGKDLSMWDIIDAQPPPVITREQARIGAALFREAVEKQRIWRESGVKIPDPPRRTNRLRRPLTGSASKRRGPNPSCRFVSFMDRTGCTCAPCPESLH